MRKHLSRALVMLLVVALMVPMMLTSFAADPEEMTVGIFTTTDMHGRCCGKNPLNGSTVTNSMLRVATAMKQARETYDDTILVDAGDLIQGTAMTAYNVSVEGGANNPMALCLRYIEYDAFIPGNHEFNYTMDVQQRFYDILADNTDKYIGAQVDTVAANIVVTATQETVHKPYKIKEFEVGGKTFKVGILGFENANVPNWDPESHYQGYSFAHEGNPDNSYAWEWNNIYKKEMLEDEGCDIVIMVSHTGNGSQTSYNQENQLYHFTQNTTGIDMVIGGHSHSAHAGVWKNQAGEDVISINAGTTNIGSADLTLRSDGTYSIGNAKTNALNATNADKTPVYPDDPELTALMQPYYDNADAYYSQEVATVSGNWDTNTNNYTEQTDTQTLVHEAQLWATGAQISIAAPVTTNNDAWAVGSGWLKGEESAKISLKNAYDIYRYDNNLLYMIEINGKQIRNWLEHLAANYYTINSGKVATKGDKFGRDNLYGIDYEMYLGEPEGERIKHMTYQGKPVTDDMVFTCAINSYRLSASEGNDAYGWYAATGITDSSPEVIWEGAYDEKFTEINGSMTLIIGEYFKYVTAQGKDLTPPERKSTWTIYVDSYDSVPLDNLAKAADEAAELIVSGLVDKACEDVADEFYAALEAAETLLIIGSNDDAKVAAATERLWAAIRRVELDVLVHDANALDLDDYMDGADKTAFINALNSAEEMLAKESATAEELAAAYDALDQAAGALVKKADKSALNALIEKAEGIDLSKYPADLAKAVEEALKAAKEVAADETLTEADQAVVDAAAKALSDALNALKAYDDAQNVKPPVDNGGNPNTGDAMAIASIVLLVVAGAAVVLLRKKQTLVSSK